MDPDANLKEQRELLRSMRRTDVPDRTDEEFFDDILRLMELAEAMDQWLVAGGFLPRDWQPKNPPKH